MPVRGGNARRIATRARSVVAFLADEERRNDLLRFVRAHRSGLASFRLVAARPEAAVLIGQAGLPVEVLGRDDDGYRLMRDRLSSRELDAVIFLRAPFGADPSWSERQNVLEACDATDVPVATNAATAEIVLHFLLAFELRNPPGEGWV